MSLTRSQAATAHLPALAKFQGELAGGVALYDVSPLVPKGRRRAKHRNGMPIDRLVIHHSGSEGKAGFEGAWRSVDFMTRPKWKGGRDFPISGYHLWVSREPIIDVMGRFVVLQLAAFTDRCWHSGGMLNDRGIGLCLQGNTSRKPISPFQVECLEAVIPWAERRWPKMHMPDSLTWHSEAEKSGGRSKKACPGMSAESWLRGYAARAA